MFAGPVSLPSVAVAGFAHGVHTSYLVQSHSAPDFAVKAVACKLHIHLISCGLLWHKNTLVTANWCEKSLCCECLRVQLTYYAGWKCMSRMALGVFTHNAYRPATRFHRTYMTKH